MFVENQKTMLKNFTVLKTTSWQILQKYWWRTNAEPTEREEAEVGFMVEPLDDYDHDDDMEEMDAMLAWRKY